MVVCESGTWVSFFILQTVFFEKQEKEADFSRVIMQFIHVFHSYTHTLLHFFGKEKGADRQTMSSHGVNPPCGPRPLIAAPPPACSEASDGFISYL